MNNMPILIALVGLPRSGKSTYARSLRYPIVCPDSIRMAIHGQPYIESAEPLVWATAKIMVSSLFRSGHEMVILDATNLTVAQRVNWLSPEWGTTFIYIPTSEDECIQRAVDSGQENLVPVIKRMAETMDLEGINMRVEGF